MAIKIKIKEVSIEEVVKVNTTIIEFDSPYQKDHFEERYKDREKLIIVAYIDDKPAGYIVGYDKFSDGSFYCWMAGVNPSFRSKGVLKTLMDYEDKWAKEKGYKKIRIKTRNNRREMLFYLVKYGFFFTEVTQHPNIKDNRILLEKELYVKK
ncbi:MAG: GNAT family N-acetyltransferase [Candidatus Pacebacteria bacterium]|nr:GNAT family N-acetyltransferase [Candidatus Paceibacterota bacterium]